MVEAPEKLPQENVFFEHRDLPYIDAVHSTFICSELHIFQIQNFIPFKKS